MELFTTHINEGFYLNSITLCFKKTLEDGSIVRDIIEFETKRHASAEFVQVPDNVNAWSLDFRSNYLSISGMTKQVDGHELGLFSVVKDKGIYLHLKVALQGSINKLSLAQWDVKFIDCQVDYTEARMDEGVRAAISKLYDYVASATLLKYQITAYFDPYKLNTSTLHLKSLTDPESLEYLAQREKEYEKLMVKPEITNFKKAMYDSLLYLTMTIAEIEAAWAHHPKDTPVLLQYTDDEGMTAIAELTPKHFKNITDDSDEETDAGILIVNLD